MMNKLTCPACLEQLEDPRTLGCGHTYCQCCLQMMMTKRNRIQCHICKAIHRTADERNESRSKNHKISTPFITERKSRDVQRKSCTSAKLQRERQRQREQDAPNRQVHPLRRQQSKLLEVEAENNKLNESESSDASVVESGANVKHFQVQEQRQKRDIEGALVTDIGRKQSNDSSQQKGGESGFDAVKLPCTELAGTAGAPEPAHQPEAEKHVNHENGTESNHQEEQRSNMEHNRKESSVEGNMTTLMMKLATIRNLYKDSCCHGCGSEEILMGCLRCRAAMYCSEDCARRDLELKHLAHCDEMLKLRSEIRGIHFKHFFLPQLHREKLSLLISEHEPKRCGGCRGETNRKLKKCAKCACAMYCSKTCQVKDWSIRHKRLCADIRRLRELVYEETDSRFIRSDIAQCPDIDTFVDIFIDIHGVLIDTFRDKFGHFPELPLPT